MFCSFTKIPFNNFFLFILSLGVFSRIFFYFYFGQDYLNFEDYKAPLKYLDALSDHSWEFLKNYHYKPIGFILKDILIFHFFGHIEKINFLLTSCLDIFATILLGSILYIFGVRSEVTILTCSIFSLNLIGWEYWRSGNHFDHLNVFIFSFYTWSIVRFILNNNTLNCFFVGFSSILLVLFYSLGYIIIPIITSLMFLFGKINLKTRSFTYLIFLPFLTILIILVKNFITVGVIAPSSLSGANTLQFASYSEPNFNHFDTNTIVRISKKVKMKDWWHWCLNQSFKHNSKGYVQGQTFGKCFTKKGNEIDFTNLKTKLEALNETKILQAVELDEKLVKNKPWFFSKSNNFHFSVMYMQEGMKIWKYLIFNEPFNFLKRAYWSARLYFKGLYFFTNTKYEPNLMINNNIIKVAALFTGPILLLGVLNAFYKCFQLIYFPIINLRNVKKENIIFPSIKQLPICLLSILFILTSLFLIIVTYGENSRMFISISVIPFFLGVLKINDIIINNKFIKSISVMTLLFIAINTFLLLLYDHFFEYIFNNFIKFI